MGLCLYILPQRDNQQAKKLKEKRKTCKHLVELNQV